MKKHIFIALGLLVIAWQGIVAQSTTQNYIKTITYMNESGTGSLNTIQYYDGLGRPIQTAQVGITPDHHDLVTYQEYDSFGRNSNAWLPRVKTSNNGNFVPFNTFKDLSPEIYQNDPKAYSKPVYETSPLNRILEQYGPGQSWHNNSKSVKIEYLTNTAIGERSCAYYEVTADGKLKKNGNYPANQLYVTRTTDEEGKNITYEFKDKLDQVILIRQMNGPTDNNTYYVYDDFGQKRFILPPAAASSLTANTTWNMDIYTLTEYVYIYKYDDRNRCIWKKLPGCDPIYYVYDKADRLILSQDGEQRLKGKWSFSIPDDLERVVLTGVCRNTVDNTSTYLSEQVVRASFSTSGAYKGYTVSGIALAYPMVLTANYYDNYDFLNIPGFGSTRHSGKNMHYATHSQTEYNTRYGTDADKVAAKGMLTGTAAASLNRPEVFNCAAYYYDSRGRMIQSLQLTLFNLDTDDEWEWRYTSDREHISYNYVGQPLKRYIEHDPPYDSSKEEHYTYTYDHAGRLDEVKYGSSYTDEFVLAKNTYDELGRLKSTKTNNKTNLATNYTYNVRSWLTGISNPLFGESLQYTYNGNIKTTNYNQGNRSGEWEYRYDDISQLVEYYGATGEYMYCEYDRQGNPNYLYRYTENSLDGTYFYYSGNRLIEMLDDYGMSFYPDAWHETIDYVNLAGEYTYNKNGAMTKDLNKGLSDIKYNLLNLPEQIDIKSPVAEAREQYYYTATGEKLAAVHRWNPNYSTNPVIGSTVNTSHMYNYSKVEYLKNKEYDENGNLLGIKFDNGYYSYDTNTSYVYLKDHLGNIRVVADLNGNVAQRNYYEPFGAILPGSTNQNLQPYKFGGKELNLRAGLNWYDFGARPYDPVGMRFLTVDPLAEKYPWISPYAYCLNNPLRYIDPKGEAPTVYEAALMSNHVYNNQGELIGGWKVSERQIDNVKYSDEKNGFKSNLYERTQEDGTIEYAYITAGTDITSSKDWGNNIEQLNGNSEQYQQSVDNATIISGNLGDAELTFAGHSLGGGLAAANSLATGKDAITFNAAALSQATKDGLNLTNRDGSIFNVVVKGEILNYGQSMAGMKLENTPYYLKASYLPNPVGMVQRVHNHMMGVVIKKLKSQ